MNDRFTQIQEWYTAAYPDLSNCVDRDLTIIDMQSIMDWFADQLAACPAAINTQEQFNEWASARTRQHSVLVKAYVDLCRNDLKLLYSAIHSVLMNFDDPNKLVSKRLIQAPDEERDEDPPDSSEDDLELDESEVLFVDETTAELAVVALGRVWQTIAQGQFSPDKRVKLTTWAYGIARNVAKEYRSSHLKRAAAVNDPKKKILFDERIRLLATSPDQ